MRLTKRELNKLAKRFAHCTLRVDSEGREHLYYPNTAFGPVCDYTPKSLNAYKEYLSYTEQGTSASLF